MHGLAQSGSPSEERGAGDEEGEDPHAEADVDGEALGPPAPGVGDGPRDGEVAVDRDGAQTNVGSAGLGDDDGCHPHRHVTACEIRGV